MFDALTEPTATDKIGPDLSHYLDAFDPPFSLSQAALTTVGIDVIPPLLAALADRGLSVYVTHDLSYLENVRESSRGGMQLVKVNDPKFHPQANRDDANVLLLARGAELVGCIASRLLWCEQSLAEELESGRFWVSSPASMWTERDRCVTNSLTARSIASCPVVYCGSVYLDPSIRGGATLAAMCRLHCLWLVCHWRWSWLVGFIESGLLHHHAFDIYGADLVEQGLWLTRDDDELHHYHVVLTRRLAAMSAWIRPEMGDLSRPLGRPPRSILPREAPEPVRHGHGR